MRHSFSAAPPPYAGCAFLLALALGTALGLDPTPGRADFVAGVTVDTSPLVAEYPNSPGLVYGLQFVLIDGSGTGDSSTTVNISNLSYGSGSGPAGPLSLTDNAFIVIDTEVFTPGSTLGFTLDIQHNAALPSDTFEFTLLSNVDPANPQTTGTPIATTDPFGSLLTIDVTPNPDVMTFQGTVDPPITIVVTSVPEPSVLAMGVLVGAGALIVGWTRRRPRRT